MNGTDLDRHPFAAGARPGANGHRQQGAHPRVGCVIGAEDGHVFGIGARHQAAARTPKRWRYVMHRPGASRYGATAWGTLEPCAHHGRTPLVVIG
jgi:pyrimidine deaminase RibD-like protein